MGHSLTEYLTLQNAFLQVLIPKNIRESEGPCSSAGGTVAMSAGAVNRSPRPVLLPTVSCPRVPCVPISRLPNPRPRPLPMRARLHAPLGVKAVQVVVRGWCGHARLGLDAEWYTGCARTGGSFVVNVVDRSTSLESR